MDKHEILLFPPFPSASKERTRKKLWRSAVEVVASDDEEDSDMDEHECAFFPAKRHCTQLSSNLSDTIVDKTRPDTVFICRAHDSNCFFSCYLHNVIFTILHFYLFNCIN